MDQAKTSLPHIPSNPKCFAGEYSLPTHLTGVNIHGKQPVIFIDWGQFPHDSNLTINVILQITVHYKVHILCMCLHLELHMIMYLLG